MKCRRIFRSSSGVLGSPAIIDIRNCRSIRRFSWGVHLLWAYILKNADFESTTIHNFSSFILLLLFWFKKKSTSPQWKHWELLWCTWSHQGQDQLSWFRFGADGFSFRKACWIQMIEILGRTWLSQLRQATARLKRPMGFQTRLIDHCNPMHAIYEKGRTGSELYQVHIYPTVLPTLDQELWKLGPDFPSNGKSNGSPVERVFSILTPTFPETGKTGRFFRIPENLEDLKFSFWEF